MKMCSVKGCARELGVDDIFFCRIHRVAWQNMMDLNGYVPETGSLIINKVLIMFQRTEI